MAPFRMIIRREPIALETDVGSIAEAIGLLQAEDARIRELIATADDLNGSNGEAPAGDAPATAPEAPKTRKPRGSNKDKGDPATATAPAPEAIPGVSKDHAAPAAPATAPAPELAAQNAAAAANGDIPDYLKRPAAAAAAPPPPPPAIPPAPPAPPAAPPSGVLAGKVIAELDKRMGGNAGTGEALAGWLAQCGLVKAGTTYTDAIDAVRMLADDKVAVIAGQLNVA